MGNEAGPLIVFAGLGVVGLIVVIALAVVALALVAAAVVFVLQLRGKQEDIAEARAAMDRLAPQLGLTRTAGGLEGNYRGVAVRVQQLHERRGSGSKAYSARVTQASVTLARPLGLGLSVRRADLRDDALAAVGAGTKDLQLGDAALDAALVIAASDPSAADVLRKAGRELSAASGLPWLVIDDRSMRIRNEEWAGDAATITHWLDTLTALATALDRARFG